MQFFCLEKVPIVKSDIFYKSQCLESDNERTQMQAVSYISVVSTLMYAEVCTRPNIAYIVGVLGRDT